MVRCQTCQNCHRDQKYISCDLSKFYKILCSQSMLERIKEIGKDCKDYIKKSK